MEEVGVDWWFMRGGKSGSVGHVGISVKLFYFDLSGMSWYAVRQSYWKGEIRLSGFSKVD